MRLKWWFVGTAIGRHSQQVIRTAVATAVTAVELSVAAAVATAVGLSVATAVGLSVATAVGLSVAAAVKAQKS